MGSSDKDGGAGLRRSVEETSNAFASDGLLAGDDFGDCICMFVQRKEVQLLAMNDTSTLRIDYAKNQASPWSSFNFFFMLTCAFSQIPVGISSCSLTFAGVKVCESTNFPPGAF